MFFIKLLLDLLLDMKPTIAHLNKVLQTRRIKGWLNGSFEQIKVCDDISWHFKYLLVVVEGNTQNIFVIVLMDLNQKMLVRYLLDQAHAANIRSLSLSTRVEIRTKCNIFL